MPSPSRWGWDVNTVALPLGLHFNGNRDPAGHPVSACSWLRCGRPPAALPASPPPGSETELLAGVDDQINRFEEELGQFRVDLDRVAAQLAWLRTVRAARADVTDLTR
jgi:hypothetical protein